MSHPTPARTEPTAQADDAHHLRSVLLELIDLGRDLARLVHQQAMATQNQAEPNRPAADFTIPFERIARSIRRAILLVEKLDQPTPTGYDIALAAQSRAAARHRAVREVDEDLSILSDAELAERTAHLDHLDRLDPDPDLDPDLAPDLNIDHARPARPIREIIADIRADLIAAATDSIGPQADPPGTPPRPQSPAKTPYPLRL